ncbi:MAG: cupredoxin family copper-binding protein [DPANN group archaeon]|nr:cupredoxin family copper-binding protein [DPANN group archaeon]
MNKINALAAIFVLAAAVFFISGCASYQTTAPTTTNNTTTAPAQTATPPTTSTATSSVTLQNFAFHPADITVAKGAIVTWTNMDSVTHTIAANDGSFSSGNIAPGGTYAHTFGTAGVTAYHCSIHPSMTGTVTVT